MDSTELSTRVFDLRARGLSPKEIARTLGVRRAEVEPLIRAHARSTASAAEPAVVGCWASPGWSHGLRWDGARGWGDEHPHDERQLPNLVSVLVAREHRYGKVSACGYLVDTHCLGVKNAIGPRVLDAYELGEFRWSYFRAYDEEPQHVPVELARELVLGAADYARRLGFEPHPDFEACRAQLGAWNGPGAIEFGRPLFVPGPHDDVVAIIRTLERTVGRGSFDYVVLGT
jgi:hypothetical protein